MRAGRALIPQLLHLILPGFEICEVLSRLIPRIYFSFHKLQKLPKTIAKPIFILDTVSENGLVYLSNTERFDAASKIRHGLSCAHLNFWHSFLNYCKKLKQLSTPHSSTISSTNPKSNERQTMCICILTH